MKSQSSGLTLIELVTVIAIIGILILVFMMAWRNQLDKARDAQKKEDLQRLSIAFEEYFSDWNCYPDSSILDNCGGSELAPYLDSIPCNPVTTRPYCYITDASSPTCHKNFRLLTELKFNTDEIISKLGCDGELYCGWEEQCAIPEANISGFNYGVSSTNITVASPDLPSPAPSPLPSSSSSPTYACTPLGNCDTYANTSSCGIIWESREPCNDYCPTSTLEERCDH